MYEYFNWPVAKKRDTGARPVENREDEKGGYKNQFTRADIDNWV